MKIMGLLNKGGTTVMTKHRTKRPISDPSISVLTPASMRQMLLPRAVLDTRIALREFLLAAGMKALLEELEDDRTLLCGPKGRFQDDRRAYRHGHDTGQLVMGGRKVRVLKPRARSVDGGELELPHWRHFSQEDPLDERVQEQILMGISTRDYRNSLERLPVLLQDGVVMGEHLLLTALGIDATGLKQVLGVVEGGSESEEVAKSLFRDLIERGLAVERARLFVIDGGKGLRKAIRTVFGDWALVQRCQVHKQRNVLDHLPERQRTWVRAALHRAWSAATVERGRELLRNLAAQLRMDHPGAASSIDEGLDETLTFIALGVFGALQRTLATTNPIENLQGTIRRVSRNVKRWRGGSMALRWTVSAFMRAERKFRRVKGHADMPRLVAALDALIGVGSMDRKVNIA